jgi:hypothetical protein
MIMRLEILKNPCPAVPRSGPDAGTLADLQNFHDSGMNSCLSRAILLSLFIKGFTQRNRSPEQFLEFRTLLSPDINMVIRAQEAGLEFPIGSNPETVAECAEFRIMERSDNFDFGPVKAEFFAVVHSPGDDLF